jgi:hypothetical protein
MAGKRRHYLQLSNGSVPGVSLRFRALSGRADQMCSFPNCLFFLTCDMQSGCDEEGIDAGNLNSIHLRKRRSLAGKSRAPRQSSQFLSGSRPALPILDWRPAQFCVATGHARMFEECRVGSRYCLFRERRRSHWTATANTGPHFNPARGLLLWSRSFCASGAAKIASFAPSFFLHVSTNVSPIAILVLFLVALRPHSSYSAFLFFGI